MSTKSRAIEKREIRRGEVYYADLTPVQGSEQGGVRPVVIVQNNVGNKHSPTTVVAVITSRSSKTKLPTHVDIGYDGGLHRQSIVLLEQIRTIDKTRLENYLTTLKQSTMERINYALSVSVGLDTAFCNENQGDSSASTTHCLKRQGLA